MLAEQVGFSLFFEVGFNDAGPAATVGHGIAQSQITGFTALVLVNSHEMGDAAALGIGATHCVAWRLGSHHPYVDVCTWNHLVVMHVKAMGKCQRSALLHVGRHVVGVDLADLFVGQQDHDDVSHLHCVVDFHHGQAGFANFVP